MKETERKSDDVHHILLLGFGVVKFIFGGMVSFSNAKIALIMLEIPAAPSPWPTFDFTLNYG